MSFLGLDKAGAMTQHAHNFDLLAFLGTLGIVVLYHVASCGGHEAQREDQEKLVENVIALSFNSNSIPTQIALISSVS